MKLVKRIVLEPSVHKSVETLAKEKYWGLVDEYARRIQSESISREMEMGIDRLPGEKESGKFPFLSYLLGEVSCEI